jgi:hypothetical protein
LQSDYFSKNRQRADSEGNQILRMGLEPTTAKDLLIERDEHFCDIDMFKQKFASVYLSKKRLGPFLASKHLEIKSKINRRQSEKKMIEFSSYILRQPLSKKESQKMYPIKIINEEKKKQHNT